MSPATHTVTNQPPPLTGDNVFTSDVALTQALQRELAEKHRDTVLPELTELGRVAGSEEAREWGRLANEHPPQLRTHDRYGHRVDEVEFHPAWHRLMEQGVAAGLTDAWSPGGQLRRTAGFYVWSQVEAGHGCPLSMTHAAVPALRAERELAERWVPLLTSRSYEPGLTPAGTKAGALAGMGMTEKQGGSDVRANTTVARPTSTPGEYVLTGHKWFCSAPMCDVFLVLAQVPDEGLSCFLVPRVLPDGARNTFRIQRLKDKLGNRSNASSEVEFEDTVAWRVGEVGRGVATIIEMVAATRLDCVTGSAALMRQALSQALHHCAHRSAFGGLLLEKPLMRSVLADLALESEAATALALRLAVAQDRATEGDALERHFLRLALPTAKFWVTKRCTPMVAEALECLGGNGYVEESGLPRLLRESPLNSLWEGSGNVQALDVLRALQREPRSLEAFLAEIGRARGGDHRLDAAIKQVLTELSDLDGLEAGARRLVERMGLLLQASLLVQHAPAEVADAFCAARLGPDAGLAFGTLPRGLNVDALVERARGH
ncbi:acyl-CoA dehydrogenase family protein [Streptomyces sp. NPDC005438]|uniref:acyl-CoA dehydrogenase family protein n=1 Tax=Streptomyces sp. NPDC005438 TaxID=3156880 RepID=UPI0033ADB4CE